MVHRFGRNAKANLRIINKFAGRSLADLSSHFGYTGNKFGQLNKGTSKQKGIVGDFIEELITGIPKDNLCEADSDIGDIKSVGVKSDGIPRENLRLSAINFNTIQQTAFRDSGLARKGKIILVKYIKADDIIQSKIHSVVTIDLLDEEIIEQVESDYNIVRQAVQRGQADKLTSSKNQPGKIIKTYSHGSGDNNKKYIDSSGNMHTAKGKAFYLFKEDIQTFGKKIV